MSVCSNKFTEKLYLSKEENGEVYINNCQNLYKNQINGLRALYKLFIKKNPGAILNNPSSSGKTVLVCLFIEAIQKILNNPVLILCNDDHEIQYWKNILLEWTKFTTDNIAIESKNPYLKKGIFLKKTTDLISYFRRTWSVLVIKNEEMTKEISKMVFDADFKIWMTSVDVFRDLKMLSSVSKWINPNININIKDFEISNKSVPEIIFTMVLLETFTEDFVVRTDNVKSLVQKAKESHKITQKPTPTEKNKDATGTKIKRSKRKICDPSNKIVPNKKSTSDSIENPTTKNEEHETRSLDFEKTNKVEDNSPSILNVTSIVCNNDKSHTEKDIEIGIDKANTQSLDNNLNVKEGSGSLLEIDMLDTEIHPKLRYSEDSTESLNLYINENIDNSEQIQSSEMDTRIKYDIKTNHAGLEVKDHNTQNATETNDNEAKKNKTDIQIEHDESEINRENEIKNDLERRNIIEKSFDEKIRELEANTLKKYKGSILDSLF